MAVRPLLLLLGTVPAFLVVAARLLVLRPRAEDRATTASTSRSRRRRPSRRSSPRCSAQGGEAGSYEFTATLFDLIRRGVYASKPVTTERSVWGGLRTESVSDLELSAGKQDSLTPWERAVADVVDDVIADGSERLSRFREKIEDDRETMSKRFTSFKAKVGTEVGNRKWLISRGVVPLVLALVAFVAVGALLFYLGVNGWRSVYPRWSDVVLIGLAVAAFVNAAIVLGALTQRKLWRRRSPDGEVEAERWEAFRRYLTDFPRLQEAPPATLALWERFLVYGIAFGIADRVLQAAHLAMPEALAQASSIYWISPGGDLGSGASSMGIGDLASGFGSALAPPSSGSGGGGGGFSGGGGEEAAGAAAARGDGRSSGARPEPGARPRWAPSMGLAHARRRNASQSAMAPAAATLSDSASPGIGIAATASQACEDLVRQPRPLGAEHNRHGPRQICLTERDCPGGVERDEPPRPLLPRHEWNAEDRPGARA